MSSLIKEINFFAQKAISFAGSATKVKKELKEINSRRKEDAVNNIKKLAFPFGVEFNSGGKILHLR